MATLSKKLQSEIDHILSHVDERTLFAEFRENEIFDIQNGDKKEVVRYTLDERIIMNRQSPRTASMAARLERTTTNAAEKITGMRRMVNYLFKPLQY
ncbi:MAG: hypothetical protein K0S38_95 [Candidatus Paceibacter sp.]|nr:hypothetical protein [Candidatus Paceibacter sp.]